MKDIHKEMNISLKVAKMSKPQAYPLPEQSESPR